MKKLIVIFESETPRVKREELDTSFAMVLYPLMGHTLKNLIQFIGISIKLGFMEVGSTSNPIPILELYFLEVLERSHPIVICS